MKLIRQNDESGGLVLTQNLAGKAMKQNYNFGKAWKSYNPAGAYIDFQKVIAYGEPFSTGFFYKDIGGFTMRKFYGDLNSDTTYAWEHFTNSYRFNSNGAVSGYITGLTLAASSSDGLGMTFYNGSSLQSISKSTATITLGLVREQASTVSKYVKVNGLFIYDRTVTLNELNYRRNLNLGNELLNTMNLWAEYPLSGAEILNTGGADFVGVRDSSGNNRHVPILSLPAGTLQQQLDWANLNCFETW